MNISGMPWDGNLRRGLPRSTNPKQHCERHDEETRDSISKHRDPRCYRWSASTGMGIPLSCPSTTSFRPTRPWKWQTSR